MLYPWRKDNTRYEEPLRHKVFQVWPGSHFIVVRSGSEREPGPEYRAEAFQTRLFDQELASEMEAKAACLEQELKVTKSELEDVRTKLRFDTNREFFFNTASKEHDRRVQELTSEMEVAVHRVHALELKLTATREDQDWEYVIFDGTQAYPEFLVEYIIP